jgi:hypothetical protein
MTITENSILKLELEVQDINLVLLALQELPARVSNPLTKKIVEYITPQLNSTVQKTDNNINVNLSSGANIVESFK